MTPRIILGAALAAGLALPLGAAPALAQAQPPAARAAATSPSAEVEAHITKLRDELGITPAELPQWNAFTAVMRENAAAIEKVYEERSQHSGAMNAVEILQSYRDFAQVHLADLDKLVPAFSNLYAVLSPAQQKTADALFANRTGGRGR